VAARGVYPPVDPLASLSRLMRKGAGPGRTRADHLGLAAQALAALAHARDVRELGELVGADALSAADRRYLRFETVFERDVVGQRPDEDRSVTDTLDRIWRALAVLPRRDLTMLPAEQVAAHLDDSRG
jgi:V/A-type H+-transporting ATPase subunit B